MTSTGSSTSTAARLLVGERRSLLFPFPRNHDQRRMIHSVAVSNSQDRQLLLLRRSRRYCWISTTTANLPLRQDFNKMRRPKRLLNRPPLVQAAVFGPVEVEEKINEFSGLHGNSDTPVGICQTRTLPPALFLDDALAALQAAIVDLEQNPIALKSGILRFEVPLPPGIKPLQWLQSQARNSSVLFPRSYFSPRAPRGDGEGATIVSEDGFNVNDIDACSFLAVAGVGSTVTFSDDKPFSKKSWQATQRFLSKGSPSIRMYGGMRFDPDGMPAAEWRPFGSFYFFVPQLELCECHGCSLLAVNIAWDKALNWTFQASICKALLVLSKVTGGVSWSASHERRTSVVESKHHSPDEGAWTHAVRSVLEMIKDSSHGSPPVVSSRYLPNGSVSKTKPGLSKVVLARRTKLELSDALDPLTLLASLQEKDPNAYQFCLQLPDGSAFIGSTPERLFARKGLLVASEAVAATRPRGPTSSEDLSKAIDLLLSPKDHNEFGIVRENVKKHLEAVCSKVEEEFHKRVIKQARVQHLYTRLVGQLKNKSSEFDLMMKLHPTPAVCGHPQALAKFAISMSESFDRGMYAGPVGWFGGDGAEFAVGIRSSLIQPHIRGKYGTTDENQTEGATVYLYAGTGIVQNSNPASEWQELNLKVSQFEVLLQPTLPLDEAVNINAVWANLIVEECCRLGVTYFCTAPGSRSSPLVAAAAENPQVTLMTCIDERSLAFHAIGYGRGANKPAAVITTSGTAVSNLLPAVVEGSQDCVPMIVLTADRPHELRATGANQAIDQVNHFGNYVRYYFDLPPATDEVSARMVLTTIDTAVFLANSSPSGPVHINCPFREPLSGIKEPWNPTCLQGIERWVMDKSPFTKYVGSMTRAPSNYGIVMGQRLGRFAEILKVIKSATRGLLVVGGLHNSEETWAVILLARHLGFPVVPDVLSGLRSLGNVFSMGNSDDRLTILQNFDQLLLSRTAAEAIAPDVILQIGGRLISKRISQFLEASNPSAHILVEEHPFRTDPSHILTHRIQCDTADFVSTIMGSIPASAEPLPFCRFLLLLSQAVEKEIHSKLSMGVQLTEPFVARMVMETLSPGSALFLGNSMPIRDADMYATSSSPGKSLSSGSSIRGLEGRVGCNRGASGIDGVLSSAIGFAVGCNQRVTLLIGDVSFLHDTNGLSILRERAGQLPVTVVVVNNKGGGIFSFLPISKSVQPGTFATLWSTQHEVSLVNLCRAHRINHMFVSTKQELEGALQFAGESPSSCVVEVDGNIEDNAKFHQFMQNSVSWAAERAFHILSMFLHVNGNRNSEDLRRISKSEYYHYRLPLAAPPTTTAQGSRKMWREGFLLRITLHNGFSGIGEVAPLEGLHQESMEEAEDQLRYLITRLSGIPLPENLPLLNGSFSDWFHTKLGVQPNTLHPSVRCGVEMAVLAALAESLRLSLSNLLMGRSLQKSKNKDTTERAKGGVKICALIESDGTPEEVADIAAAYVKQGFCTLKLKVARRASPKEDAKVVAAVRDQVGPHVHIRADANRKWTYLQAIEFAKSVQSFDLQYVEEPLARPQDIPRFCDETGIRVALDETVDEDTIDGRDHLQECSSSGVVAMVIKPGRAGGFERAAAIAEWALNHGRTPVISAAFESSISLSAYAQFATYIDSRCQQTNNSRTLGSHQDGQHVPVLAHGLGTYTWLDGDVVKSENRFRVTDNRDGSITSEMVDLAILQPELDEDYISSKDKQMRMKNFSVSVENGANIHRFHVWDTGRNSQAGSNEVPTLVFLHGFMGSGREWLPFMEALAPAFRCITFDLPGHGLTTVEEETASRYDQNLDHHGLEKTVFAELMLRTSCGISTAPFSLESVSVVLIKLLKQLGVGKFVPVGYSMGARIALYLALHHSDQMAAVISIAGSPGLEDSSARKSRAASDESLAETLRAGGLELFVESWYQQPLWASLRKHPNFEAIKMERKQHTNCEALADLLASLSVGHQLSLWDKLGNITIPALLIAGDQDTKFLKLAHKMCGRSHQRAGKVTQRSRKAVRSVGREEQWVSSQGFQIPLEFTGALPQATNEFPNLVVIPKDVSLEDFFAEEMKKIQLADDKERISDVRNNKNKAPGLEVEEGTDGTDGTDGFFRVVKIENSGHAVHLENPLSLLGILRTFLQTSKGSISGGTK